MKDDHIVPVLLADADRYSAALRRIVLGGSDLILILEVTNKSEQFIDMQAEDLYLNGTKTGSSMPAVDYIMNTFSVAPHGTKPVAVKLKKYDGLDSATEVKTISIMIRARDEEPVSPAVLTLSEPASTGSLTWINPDQLEVQQAQIAENDSRESIALLDEFIVPENAV